MSNLKVRTSDEAREIGRRGGIRSGEVRRNRRDLKNALLILLESEFTSYDGTKLTGAESVAAAIFEKAKSGDTRAFSEIRDTLYGRPQVKAELIHEAIPAEVYEKVRMALELED